MSKAWSGRFARDTAAEVTGFTASLPFDRRLWRQDIRGSIAHARMLGKQGIIEPAEAEQIISGLRQVEAEIEAGTFPFRIEHEDIHLNVEKRLIELIGPVGGKLHTGRSRNDQVALDMHLYLKDEIRALIEQVRALQAVIVDLAAEHLGDLGRGIDASGARPPGSGPPTVMPGYTHLQRAQPVLFSHHILAYFWMLQRDRERLADCLRRTDISPLGAGALAGTSFPIDRVAVAAELGLARLYENSMDAVSDRDYLVEFLAAASLIMVHLSRLCEELVLWSSTEFGFVEIDDRYATGSSIMPQKKNPDVAELVRGKAGRVFGSLLALLTTLKGTALAYHTDLQEDKERTFDALDTLRAALPAMTGMLATLHVRRERMAAAARNDFSNATDLADYLARRGMPFRAAHEVAGRLVRHCLERGKLLEDCSLPELQGFSPLFEADVFAAITPEACVAGRASYGGTAPSQVVVQLRQARTLALAGVPGAPVPGHEGKDAAGGGEHLATYGQVGRIAAVVKAVVVRDGRALLLHNSPAAGEGWDLPGGRVEFGEQPEAALLREAREETGLELRVGPLVDAWSVVEHGYHRLGVVYRCAADSGEVRLSPEHAEWRWVTREQAEGLNLPPWMRRGLALALR